MIDLLILAVEGGEGIPPDHIAAKLAVPLGILIFGGSVYLLLWAIYGAKKGALVYSTAFFGFTMMLGVFWWFGAPGTPIATGLREFPGQEAGTYATKWFAMEPGSERAELFPATNSLDGFSDVATFLGMPDADQQDLEGDPKASALSGDLEQARDVMIEMYLPRDEADALRIGGQRRSEYQEAANDGLEQAVDDPDAWERADPFFTPEVDGDILVTESRGTRVAGTRLVVLANFVEEGEMAGETVSVEVDSQPMFAFQDPGAMWFPSAVWTLVSLLLFAASLFGLDRIEQREKRQEEEVEEPEDLAVPIAQ